jgi:MoxR-like ATPase
VQGEKQFQGEWIKIEEFNKLDTDAWQIINIYDNQQVLRHRLKARKSLRAHSVDIEYNAVELSFVLRTHKVERTEIILKKPHPLLVTHWTALHERLTTYIREQQARLREELPGELQGI